MYIVALRYTRKAGGYHGVVTSVSYSDKAEFEKLFTSEMKEQQEVVEEGISEERAVELAQQTPLACRIAASLQEVAGVDGKVNPSILAMKIQTAVFAESVDVQAEKS